MKLTLRHVETPSGPHVALCDESGEALPAQMRCEVVSEPGDVPKVVVTFVIDGDDLRLIGE